MWYSCFIKRVIDVVIAISFLVILSPIFILTALLLVILNKGNVFFTQERPGFQERKVRIIKFKSMSDKTNANGILLSDVERLTRFGGFIRNTSIDELPQLLNVIKGDMSLVGPRPLLFKYLPLYSEEQKRRHLVKPGITGWAQVNGRNKISWKEKFEYDTYYVDNVSFTLDMKIIWLTVLKVIRRDDVNQSVERPMIPFDGTN